MVAGEDDPNLVSAQRDSWRAGTSNWGQAGSCDGDAYQPGELIGYRQPENGRIRLDATCIRENHAG